MENASKALLIAGAVLISIFTVSLGVVIVSSSNGSTDSAKKTSEVIGSKSSKAIESILSSTQDYPVKLVKIECYKGEWGQYFVTYRIEGGNSQYSIETTRSDGRIAGSNYNTPEVCKFLESDYFPYNIVVLDSEHNIISNTLTVTKADFGE